MPSLSVEDNLWTFDVPIRPFPKPIYSSANFARRDGTRGFHVQYHGSFDIVNVRLLNMALCLRDNETFSTNVLEILLLDGYLELQEVDPAESFNNDLTLEAGHQKIDQGFRELKAVKGLSPLGLSNS